MLAFPSAEMRDKGIPFLALDLQERGWELIAHTGRQRAIRLERAQGIQQVKGESRSILALRHAVGGDPCHFGFPRDLDDRSRVGKETARSVVPVGLDRNIPVRL